MFLQKVNTESDKPGSGALLKVVLYILSVVAAYLIGYYQRPKAVSEAPPAPPATVSVAQTPMAPADEAANVPLSTPEAMNTPAPVAESSAPAAPVRVEKAVAMASATPAAEVSQPPEKPANLVTITEPVQIPVTVDGKITGYVNLQRGQQVSYIAVDHDQVKVKTGNAFVMVPITSTDMAH